MKPVVVNYDDYIALKAENERLREEKQEREKGCEYCADLIESLQAQLADYHHMSELVDGKMEENQRLRRINENLQEQLAEKIHIKLRTDEDILTPAEAIETINRLRKAYRKTTAQLTASQRRAQDARNELCQKCGRYRDAHKGACDGCGWMA